MLRNINSLETSLAENGSLIKLEELDPALKKIVGELPLSSNALDDLPVFLNFLEETAKRNPELSFSKKIQTVTQLLLNPKASPAGIKGIIDIVKGRINTTEFIFAFIKASKIQSEKIKNIEDLDRVGRNEYLNYLRIVGILPPEEYNNIHEEGLYNFTQRKNPNNFTEHVISYISDKTDSIIKEKEIISLGPGACSDEIYLIEKGAKSLKIIDNSDYVLKQAKEKIKDFPENIQKKFILPQKPEDMFESLEKMKKDGEKTDIFYSHSSLHFFDMNKFKKLLTMMKNCLNPNGYLVFAVKAPGATMDGNGMCMVNQESQSIRYDDEDIDMTEFNMETTKVINRGWLNNDGILRFYRDLDVIENILKSIGFCIKRSTKDSLEGYATDGVDQTAYYFICQVKVV